MNNFNLTVQNPEGFRVKTSNRLLSAYGGATQDLKSTGFPRCFKDDLQWNIVNDLTDNPILLVI